MVRSRTGRTIGDCLLFAFRGSLAMGTPVVVTDVGANREIVRPGEIGLLVAPRDTPSSAAAILTSLHERDSARRMAERGRAEICARLGATRRACAMLEIYREARG